MPHTYRTDPVTPTALAARQRVVIEPPLSSLEVRFVASFHRAETDLRRVWPGQPSSRSPWSASSDGAHLVLDEAPDADEAITAAGWLRFLAHEFLAPRGEDALRLALRNGLDGGHRLTGRVLIDEVRLITVSNNRVNERVLQRRPDADVFDLGDHRRAQASD